MQGTITIQKTTSNVREETIQITINNDLGLRILRLEVSPNALMLALTGMAERSCKILIPSAVNKYFCKAEEWDDGEWIEEDSMFNAAEVYARKWEGDLLKNLDLHPHSILVEVTKESGQKWLIEVLVQPVCQYHAKKQKQAGGV